MPWYLLQETDDWQMKSHRVLPYSPTFETHEEALAAADEQVTLHDGTIILPGVAFCGKPFRVAYISGTKPIRSAQVVGKVGGERVAVVDVGPGVYLVRVKAYLPNNYRAEQDPTTSKIYIRGRDDHGWTLDGYVIPRLASGLIAATEIKPS